MNSDYTYIDNINKLSDLEKYRKEIIKKLQSDNSDEMVNQLNYIQIRKQLINREAYSNAVVELQAVAELLVFDNSRLFDILGRVTIVIDGENVNVMPHQPDNKKRLEYVKLVYSDGVKQFKNHVLAFNYAFGKKLNTASIRTLGYHSASAEQPKTAKFYKDAGVIRYLVKFVNYPEFDAFTGRG